MLGINLFWLEQISDESLEEIYKVCSCLLQASEGEGFGLPLIEAAQHGLPIIARDISVFKEVAGNSAYYFKPSNHPEDLSSAIKEWLSLFYSNNHPKSDEMTYINWRQSTEQFVNLLQ
jgi:glycosyltransferase involved in cell wall biosynthesis